jgi:hypothetical protein
MSLTGIKSYLRAKFTFLKKTLKSWNESLSAKGCTENIKNLKIPSSLVKI